MATTHSPVSSERRARRRRQTVDEALDIAVEIMTERGVGGLTVAEVARRLGVRGPSLYKYFPSLHAVYDALFARGLRAQGDAVRVAVRGRPGGVATLRAGARATVEWCVAHPALAQLLFWRPVPGFEPSAHTFQASIEDNDQIATELAEAVRRGELGPEAARPAAARLFTVVISGLISQQMANEPGESPDSGSFTRLTDTALDMFFAHYRAHPPEGDPRADPGP